jgi:hypothetical protein
MRIYSSKHLWAPLPYGQTIRSELAGLSIIVHRLTEPLGMYLRETIAFYCPDC